MLAADGVPIAVFNTKVYNRLLVPLTAGQHPEAPQLTTAGNLPTVIGSERPAPLPASRN